MWQHIESDEFSADFPYYLRTAIEAKLGGTAIYFSGTVDGLQTPLQVNLPKYTADGKAVAGPGGPEVLDLRLPGELR